MSRVAFPLVLQSPSSGSAIVGATATITQHVVGGTVGTGPAATIYLGETGGSHVAGNQIVTDNMGRWTQGSGAGYAQYWLPQGTYDVQVSGTGLATFTITRELFSAGQSDEVALAGELKFWPGILIPAPFFRADGSAVSRASYGLLLANLALQSTGNTNGTTTVSNIPSGDIATLQTVTGGLAALLDIPISGPNIAANSIITAYNPTLRTLTLNLPTTGTATGVALLIAPHGVGDGSSTFNLPDMRRRLPLGQATTPGAGCLVGATGGALGHTHSIPGHQHALHGADTVPATPSNWTLVSVASGVAELVLQPSSGGGPVTSITQTDFGVALPSGDSPLTSGTSDPPYLACPWIIRHGLQ